MDGNMLNSIQTTKGPRVEIDNTRDMLLTDFGKAVLKDRYLLPDESYQDLFARVASTYGDDDAHAQPIYGYLSNLWFMASTPVLSNGGAGRGLPISCFLNEAAIVWTVLWIYGLKMFGSHQVAEVLEAIGVTFVQLARTLGRPEEKHLE